jgi:hypothetical protein
VDTDNTVLAVFLPNQRYHARPQTPRGGAIRRQARTPMLQGLRVFRPIPLIQPLRLALAHAITAATDRNVNVSDAIRANTPARRTPSSIAVRP